MKQRGFTMLELIVAIAILLFGIISFYTFFYSATVLNSNTYNKAMATYLAEEGLEIVKNIRDTNILSGREWSSGLVSCTLGCQLDYKTGTVVEESEDVLKPYDDNTFLHIDGDSFYSYGDGRKTIFTRKVVVALGGSTGTGGGSPIIVPIGESNVLRVEVLVYWKYNETNMEHSTIGYIYHY